jgi:two-component system chemotaxis response regulator CheB
MADPDEPHDVQRLQASCPHCRGPLSAVTSGGDRYYRCLVGHSFTEKDLFREHGAAQERMLWSAVVVLEEAAVLAREAAGRTPNGSLALERQAEDKQRQARFIRGVLDDLMPFGIEE